jgi:SAM-dependent methyltransferase
MKKVINQNIFLSHNAIDPVCPICGFADSNFVVNIVDYRYRIGRDRTLIECAQCNCNFIWPVPKDLASQYPGDYSPWFDSSIPFANSRSLKSKIKGFIFGKRKFDFSENTLNFIRQNHKDRKILEIGPGSGKFLDFCKDNRWSTFGLDMSEKATKVISDKGHKTVSWESISNYGKVDVIVMHHVLEHFHDPNPKVRELKKVLKSNGKLFIVVPNINCFLFKYYKEFYNQLDGGRHLVMYSEKTIEKLLVDNGFHIRKILTFSKASNFYGSFLRKNNFLIRNNIIRSLCFVFFRAAAFMVTILKSGEIIEIDCYKK